MNNLYWLSKKYWNNSILKRWYIKIDTIEFHRKGETFNTGTYKKSFITLIGHNVETGDWHYETLNNVPTLYRKVGNEFLENSIRVTYKCECRNDASGKRTSKGTKGIQQ